MRACACVCISRGRHAPLASVRLRLLAHNLGHWRCAQRGDKRPSSSISRGCREFHERRGTICSAGGGCEAGRGTSRREVCDTLVQSAQSNALPIPFFIRLLLQESGFRPDVVSRAGAQGIAQFMPETAASVGLDNPFDPLQAIAASARLLRNLVTKFGNLGLAAAAYNAGPRRIHDWLARKSKLPQETQHYVKTITGRPAETWKGRKPPNTEPILATHAPCREDAGVDAVNTAPSARQIGARSRLLARSSEKKTSRTVVAQSSAKSARHLLARRAKRDKGGKGAVQLAAASKKSRHKAQS
jgi:Transglycosylase SLT domain